MERPLNEHLLDPAASLRNAHGDDRFDADLAARAIAACIARDDRAILTDWFEQTLAADVAEALSRLDTKQILRVLPWLDADERARVFGYLPLDCQSDLVVSLERPAITELFEYMSSDERADLYNALPSERRELVLPALAQAEREDIRRLAGHHEGSAGSIMSSDYAALGPGLTAREAVEELRRVAPDTETIYNAYVVDGDRRLIGVVMGGRTGQSRNAHMADLLDRGFLNCSLADGRVSPVNDSLRAWNVGETSAPFVHSDQKRPEARFVEPFRGSHGTGTFDHTEPETIQGESLL